MSVPGQPRPVQPRPVPRPPGGARPGPVRPVFQPDAPVASGGAPLPGRSPALSGESAFAHLSGRPVAEHVAVFEAEHERLQRELSTIDQL